MENLKIGGYNLKVHSLFRVACLFLLLSLFYGTSLLMSSISQKSDQTRYVPTPYQCKETASSMGKNDNKPVDVTGFKALTLEHCLYQSLRTRDVKTVMKNYREILEPMQSMETFDQLDRISLRWRGRLHNVNSRDNCTGVTFSRRTLPLTALASIPGAGNTWSRHLIELITGEHKNSEL